MHLKTSLFIFIGLLCIAPAWAESDRQKFKAGFSPPVRLALAHYDSCSTLSDVKNAGSTLAQLDESAADRCSAELVKLERELELAGYSPGERSIVIGRYMSIVLNERKLHFENKPIPGHVYDPWTVRMTACFDDAVKVTVTACFSKHATALMHSSEPAETIASAVDGACQTEQTKMFSQLSGCMDAQPAQALVRSYVARLRTQVISEIVQLRTPSR